MTLKCYAKLTDDEGELKRDLTPIMVAESKNWYVRKVEGGDYVVMIYYLENCRHHFSCKRYEICDTANVVNFYGVTDL